MKDAELVSLVGYHRVIAVVRAGSAESAFRAAEAAVLGGIKLIEVEVRTPGSFRVIADLCHSCGDRAVIGAASVSDHDQVDRAIKSGAQFISMPHTSPALIESCKQHRISPIVGAFTPTEIASARAMAVPLVMIFPAIMAGGPEYVEAITTRFSDLRVGAEGGVAPENVVEFFEAGAFVVAMGRRLFTETDLQNENYDAITERSRGLLRLAGVV